MAVRGRWATGGAPAQFAKLGLTATKPHAPAAGMAPLLVQSYQVDSCMVCRHQFGVLSTKHHCMYAP